MGYFARDHAGGRPIRSIVTQARAPLFDGTPFELRGRPNERGADLWAVTPEGTGSVFAVLKKKRVRYAVVAQFFYCGAQVGIWSLLVDFAKEAANVPARTGAYFASIQLLPDPTSTSRGTSSW